MESKQLHLFNEPEFQERKGEDTVTLSELLKKADIPPEKYAEFHRLRVRAFATAQEVFDHRAVGYNVDHMPFQELVFGPVSLASEVYKRARRLAALLSPLRVEPLRRSDINRMADISIDVMNYLSWLYALVVIASESAGNENSDDAPDYLGR